MITFLATYFKTILHLFLAIMWNINLAEPPVAEETEIQLIKACELLSEDNMANIVFTSDTTLQITIRSIP